MDNTMLMEMLQTLACLATNSCDLAFGHKIGCNHNGQAPALHIFHDDPEVMLLQETVNIISDIQIMGRMHGENLINDQVPLWLLVEIHLLDGDGEVGANLVYGIHTSTFADCNRDRLSWCQYK